MKRNTIIQAITEAKRFINKAQSCLDATSETYKSGDYVFHVSAPKESGALKRASLDLTRVLAEMRKP